MNNIISHSSLETATSQIHSYTNVNPVCYTRVSCTNIQRNKDYSWVYSHCLLVVGHSSEFSFSITGGRKLWICVKDKSVKIQTAAKKILLSGNTESNR